jgi:hypothetical protein
MDQYSFFIEDGAVTAYPLGVGGIIYRGIGKRDSPAVSVSASHDCFVISYEDGSARRHPSPGKGGVIEVVAHARPGYRQSPSKKADPRADTPAASGEADRSRRSTTSSARRGTSGLWGALILLAAGYGLFKYVTAGTSHAPAETARISREIPIARPTDSKMPMNPSGSLEESKATSEGEAPADDLTALPPAAEFHRLTTYYTLVEGSSGHRETVKTSAESPAKALEVLRNFRGNPTVIDGPAVSPTWEEGRDNP